MIFGDKPTKEEKQLLNEVDNLATDSIEGYIESWKYVSYMGNVLLKAVAKIESKIDEIIISWNEKIKNPFTLSSGSFQTIEKYQPLLSKMYFVQKVSVLADYGLLKRDKGLFSKLTWLNYERNKFAHYGVYRNELRSKYEKNHTRIVILKKLKLILNDILRFKEDVGELITDKEVYKIVEMRYWK